MEKQYARKIEGKWAHLTVDFEVESGEIQDVVIDGDTRSVRVTLRRTMDWVRNFATEEELAALEIEEISPASDVPPGMMIVGKSEVIDVGGHPQFKNTLEPVPLDDMRRMARGVAVDRALQEMQNFTYDGVTTNAEAAMAAITSHLAQRRLILSAEDLATFKIDGENLRSWTDDEASAFATSAFSYVESVNNRQAGLLAQIAAAGSNDAVLAALAETD